MSQYPPFADIPPDIPPLLDTVLEKTALYEIPRRYDMLPDGRQALIIGDVEGCKEFNHLQGDNPLGFKGTCGLVSCEQVLRQFGVEVTEAEVAEYTAANGLCATDACDPALCGGTTPWDQTRLMSDFGVPAHVEFMTSPERLAELIEQGKGIIIEVNAGVLWNDPNSYQFGQSNHAIIVTGVARDPVSSHIQGFFINDSGRGYTEDFGRFVDVETLRKGWSEVSSPGGSSCVVTDKSRTFSV